MSEHTDGVALTADEAGEISLKAAQAFRPRSPINAREFFAGRWEQMTTVADAASQTGLHIVIFGERGVGKTSLANVIEPLLYVMEESIAGKPPEPRLVVKVNAHQGDGFGDLWVRAFDEVYWSEDRPSIGFDATVVQERKTLREALQIPDMPSIDDVRRTLGALRRSVFIFDEFDRGSPQLKQSFTDLIKSLSDYAVDSTIVAVGVSDTVDDLVRDHASIVRAIVQVQLPRMTEKELGEILGKASKAIGVEFEDDAAKLIIKMSQGLPHYTHLIGLHATRAATRTLSRVITVAHVHDSFEKAVQQAVQSIREKYLKAVHSAHRDALYDRVLLACAIASSTAPDVLGYFHPADVVGPLSNILDRSNVTIATFQKHINEFCEQNRASVLERAGQARAYKYRFVDPLLPPYVFMSSVADGDVTADRLATLTSRS